MSGDLGKYIVLFVGLAGLAYYVSQGPEAGPVKIAPGTVAGTVTYSDNRYLFAYQTGPLRIETMVLAGSAVQKGIRHGGAERSVFMLNEKSTQKFIDRFGAGADCPAPFLNRHVQHRLLYPADDSVRERLAKLPLGSKRDSGQWHRIHLRGRCMVEQMTAQKDGKTLAAPRNLLRNCKSFLVEDFQISVAGDIL